MVAQELMRSYQAANEALEVVNPLRDPKEDEEQAETASRYEEASLEQQGPLSTSTGTLERRQDGNGLPQAAGDEGEDR